MVQATAIPTAIQSVIYDSNVSVTTIRENVAGRIESLGELNSAFTIKQQDTSPALESTITGSDGLPLNLLESDFVDFVMKKPDSNTVITRPATLTEPRDGVVVYEWGAGDTDESGIMLAEWQVHYADGSKESFPNVGYIEIHIPSQIGGIGYSPDRTAPTISDVSITQNGNAVEVSIDSNEQIDNGSVSFNSPAAQPYSIKFDTFAETETDNGYNYFLSGTADASGQFKIELTSAVDVAGNDGASGQSDSVVIDSTAPNIFQFDVIENEGDITIFIGTDEQLANGSVSLTTPSETVSHSISEFNENYDQSMWSYILILKENNFGTYSATLTSAVDSAGNDGANNQTDSVTLAPPSPLNVTFNPINEGQELEMQIVSEIQLENFSAEIQSEHGENSVPFGGFSEVNLKSGYGYVLVGQMPKSDLSINISSYTEVGGSSTPVSESGTFTPPPQYDFFIQSEEVEGVALNVQSTVPLMNFSGSITMGNNEPMPIGFSEFIENQTGPSQYEYVRQEQTPPSELVVNVDSVTHTDESQHSVNLTDAFTPATLSNFRATNPEGQDIVIKFDTTATIDTTQTAVDVAGTLYDNPFDQTNDNEYTAIISAPSDGEYMPELMAAVTSTGNDLASGQTATVEVNTDSTAPTMTNKGISQTNGNLEILFWTDESLSGATVTVSGPTSVTLNRSDFNETQIATSEFEYLWSGAVSDGSYTVDISDLEDAAGNVNTNTTTSSVSIDATAPTITNFTAQQSSSGVGLDISFDSDESLSLAEIRISGQETATYSKSDMTESGTERYTYSVSHSGSSDGEYTAELIYATDAAENDGASGQSATVNVDTTAPQITDFFFSQGSNGFMQISVGSSEKLSYVDVDISGPESVTVSDSAFTWDSGTGFYNATFEVTTEGEYTATLLEASDAKGNDGASNQTKSPKVDLTPPTISNFSAPQDENADIEISFDSNENLSEIQVDISGAETATMFVSDFVHSTNNGVESYVATYPPSVEGEYQITLSKAIDGSGNGASDVSTTTNVDLTKPTINNFTVSNPSGTQRKVILEADEELGKINITSQIITDVVMGGYTLSDGDFTKVSTNKYELTLDDGGTGEYTYSVDSVSDTSGNTLNPNLSSSVTIQTAAKPSLSNLNLIENGSGKLEFSFDSDEQIETILISIFDGGNSIEYTEADFTETGTGPYTYTIVGRDAVAGSKSAWLVDVKDAEGNNAIGSNLQLISELHIDRPAPTISNFSASNPTSQDVEVTFDSDYALDNYEVEFAVDGSTITVSANPDFTGSGPKSYTLTHSGSTDGEWTATLKLAEDYDLQDGATGESDTVTVSTT
jgi:hypothetical protein